MTVFLNEGRYKLKSLAVWCASVACMLLLFMSLFPTFQDQSEAFIKTLEAFPEDMLRTLGLDVGTLFGVSGYASYLYGYVQLLLGIMGALWGITTVGREKIARMNDFLLVKPLSRTAILLQKLAVGFIGIVIINLVIYLVFLALSQWIPIDGSNLIILRDFVIGGFLLELVLFSFGTLIATLLKKIKSPVGLASTIGFGFYLTMLLQRLTEKEWLKALTPFSLADPIEMIKNGLSTTHGLLLVAIFLGLTVLTILFYQRMEVEV